MLSDVFPPASWITTQHDHSYEVAVRVLLIAGIRSTNESPYLRKERKDKIWFIQIPMCTMTL